VPGTRSRPGLPVEAGPFACAGGRRADRPSLVDLVAQQDDVKSRGFMSRARVVDDDENEVAGSVATVDRRGSEPGPRRENAGSQPMCRRRCLRLFAASRDSARWWRHNPASTEHESPRRVGTRNTSFGAKGRSPIQSTPARARQSRGDGSRRPPIPRARRLARAAIRRHERQNRIRTRRRPCSTRRSRGTLNHRSRASRCLSREPPRARVSSRTGRGDRRGRAVGTAATGRIVIRGSRRQPLLLRLRPHLE
jgi:hypothetical protein